MNTLLLRLATVILSLGMLGAAACSGCSPSTTDSSSSSAVMQQQSMNCGAYTHRVGNQCVGDNVKSNTATKKSTKGSPTTLNPNGNN